MTHAEALAMVAAAKLANEEARDKFEELDETFDEVESEWVDMEYEFERLTEKRDEARDNRDDAEAISDDLARQLDAAEQLLADTPMTRRYDLTDEEFAIVMAGVCLLIATLADVDDLHDSSQKQAFIRRTRDQLAEMSLGAEE